MKTSETNRRGFIKNASLLSVGFSMTLPSIMSNILPQKTLSNICLEEKWVYFTQKMAGQSFSLLQDKSPFYSESHTAQLPNAHSKWGEPIHFNNATVVARPLWKYRDNASKPYDVTILFWEKEETWQYLNSLSGSDIQALAQLSDDYSEAALLPRLGNAPNFAGYTTAQGKMDIRTTYGRKNVVSHIKIWKNNVCLMDKKVHLNSFKNLI
jgi:hypothetical protein